MNKEIQKLQSKLNEAIFEQDRRKVRYDAHVIIAETERRRLSAIVEQNQKFMNDLLDIGEKVKTIQEQLKKAIDDENNSQQDETQREGV